VTQLRDQSNGTVADAIGFIDLNAAQWQAVRQLAGAHARPHRLQAIGIEQGQGRSTDVRLTLRHDDADFAHAAFLIWPDGRYKTTEP
jgi:hypothetical protein